MINKIVLNVLLALIIIISIIGRISIGGYVLVFAGYILILFSLLHLAVHRYYLTRIKTIKKSHLSIIFASHLSYILFVSFQYDLADSPVQVVIFEFVELFNLNLANTLYKISFEYLTTINIVLFFNFILIEIIFWVLIRKYRNAEKVSAIKNYIANT